jgi:uncharacterized membrane protein YphA (DoxX/SURF4 family)
MKLIVKLNKWANAHTSLPIDFLRILLGGFLFYKGVDFIGHTEYLAEIISPVKTFGTEIFIVHYVAMCHLMGGLMIMFGLLTRLAVIVQVPILLGAVIINFVGIMDVNNFILATTVLVVAGFFLLYGSGKHSVDYNLQMNA